MDYVAVADKRAERAFEGPILQVFLVSLSWSPRKHHRGTGKGTVVSRTYLRSRVPHSRASRFGHSNWPARAARRPYARRLGFEPLEDRRLLVVALNWSGAGNALNLTEGSSGATPAISISEPTPNLSLLKINLGTGHHFASGSTTSATGLTYQNAGSPTTSQYATIDISLTNNVSSLVAALPGDGLTLGPIRDLDAGVGSITASAGTIEVTGIATYNANGNVNLAASGNLTVDARRNDSDRHGHDFAGRGRQRRRHGEQRLGMLSINAGATVVSSNTTASAITLRGGEHQHRHQRQPGRGRGPTGLGHHGQRARLPGWMIPRPWLSTAAATSTSVIFRPTL